MLRKVNLADAFRSFDEQWSPRIAGELNGQHVKLVKFQGEFVWHHHDHEDEMFLVIRGEFRMDYREDGEERAMHLDQGEFVIIPRGMEHRPVANQEVEVLLFEPASTLNTGNVVSDRTVEKPAHLA
ncbi:MAG: cupin domain-containing protein [Bryobacterales bacterium]|nr:cupin domain-containing protein [Bryobacterales bacterium]